MSNESPVTDLSGDECWQLLEASTLGRLAVLLDDGVDIFPVNFLVQDRVIFFASAPGSKLVDVARHPLVAFESDGTTRGDRWSVVVRGRATRLSIDADIVASGVRMLHSLSPTQKWNYVRILPATVSGRRFTAARRSHHAASESVASRSWRSAG